MFKTRLDTFGNTFGHFWNFENIFLKIFENSTFHGKLGKNFSKKMSKLQSKHVWIHLGTLLGIFGILKIFFLKIFGNSTLHGTLGIKFFKKFSPKHVQNTFGYIWERLWAFLEFCKLFEFFEKFRRLDLPWKTGQKFFEKNVQITIKTRLDSFESTFGHFWIFENIFFENFRKLDPPMNTGQKIFSKNFPQNMFKTRLDTFENTFGHFWNFENFFF